MRWVASELNLPYGTKIEIGLMKKPENRDVQKKSLVMKSMESVLREEEKKSMMGRIVKQVGFKPGVKERSYG